MTHIKLRSGIILCSALLAGTMLSGTAFAAETPDAASVRALQSYLLKETAPPDSADADGNGILNASDLTLLKRQILSGSRPHSGDASALRINEICASNKQSFRAPDGSSPDWIELYNSSSEPVSLGGIRLSDSKKNRYSFVFPAGTVLAGKSYLLIPCGGELHDSEPYCAPFKLSASGETIYLTAPAAADGSDGETLDQVKYPVLETDETYGRETDGGAVWRLLAPTAGTPNTDTAQVRLSAPEFSQKAGFYEDAFQLTLTADDGCTILYTTDGSDPQTSETAQVYSGSIRIQDRTGERASLSRAALSEDIMHYYDDYDASDSMDQATVVRAVCKGADGTFSRTVTNSYFISRTATFYQDMKVISISTDRDNLLDPEHGIFMQANCMEKGREWERPVNMQVFSGQKPVYSADLGMRVSGNYSRIYPQKSMTFYARSEYGPTKMHYDFFDGAAKDCGGGEIGEFDAVTLRNGGSGFDELRFRDDINAELATGLDIGTQAKNYCVAFINGEFWGLYTIQERLNEDYIESHYHVDDDNVTILKNNEGSGSDAALDEFYELYKWALTADLKDPENYARICEAMDVQSFIDYVAVQSYICNWDSLQANNNIMLWRASETDSANPYADGKWRFMLFDTEWSAGFLDSSFPENDYLGDLIRNGIGFYGMGEEDYEEAGLYYIIYADLFRSLMRNRDFAEQFRASHEKVANEYFAWERVKPLIDAYNARISDAFILTAKRFVFDDMRERALPSYRAFFEQRGEYALRYCDEVIDLYF